MTAGRVPDEWVEAAASHLAATYWGDRSATDDDREYARAALAAVMPLVVAERDRAVRDALTEATTALAAVQPLHDAFPTVSGFWDGHATGVRESARIVADLRDGAR